MNKIEHKLTGRYYHKKWFGRMVLYVEEIKPYDISDVNTKMIEHWRIATELDVVKLLNKKNDIADEPVNSLIRLYQN